jgi:hypothetical protein
MRADNDEGDKGDFEISGQDRLRDASGSRREGFGDPAGPIVLLCTAHGTEDPGTGPRHL